MPSGTTGTTTHGTRAGYRFHKQHGTEPCQSCVQGLKTEGQEQYQRRLDLRLLRIEVFGSEWVAGRSRKFQPAYEMAEWRKHAACRPTVSDLDTSDSMFQQTIPSTKDTYAYHSAMSKTKKAINICRNCPSIIECAREQILLDAPGVWAGVMWKPDNNGRDMIRDERFVA